MLHNSFTIVCCYYGIRRNFNVTAVVCCEEKRPPKFMIHHYYYLLCNWVVILMDSRPTETPSVRHFVTEPEYLLCNAILHACKLQQLYRPTARFSSAIRHVWKTGAIENVWPLICDDWENVTLDGRDGTGGRNDSEIQSSRFICRLISLSRNFVKSHWLV